MCWGDPTKSLEIARERMTAEQWEKFERQFDDFCAINGLEDRRDKKGRPRSRQAWAKWAFLCGRKL